MNFDGFDRNRMAGAHLTDGEVAHQVRMLKRTDLDHEAVCVTARDRIRYLSARVAEMEGALEQARREERERYWQPIESAPRDGTHCDIWVVGDEHIGREADAYYGRPDHVCGEAGRLCDSCPPPGDMWCDWMGNPVEGEAVAWAPKPAPPAIRARTPTTGGQADGL